MTMLLTAQLRMWQDMELFSQGQMGLFWPEAALLLFPQSEGDPLGRPLCGSGGGDTHPWVVRSFPGWAASSAGKRSVQAAGMLRFPLAFGINGTIFQWFHGINSFAMRSFQWIVLRGLGQRAASPKEQRC
jgi:hypothetical protein